MSNTNNPSLIVIPEGASALDVLAMRHRNAWDRTERGRQEWIEGTLELAAVLAEERKLLPANQDFSSWLERNELKTKPNIQDRAALIEMGKELTLAREVLEKTERTSWQHIWEKELKPRLSHVRKTSQTPKTRTKANQRIIDQVINMHCDRGYTFDETAAELGLTRNQVAGIVQRNKSVAKTPQPLKRMEREYSGALVTLTREQVDPDFKGNDIEFATKYGHVRLHTKEQIEHNKRQDVLNDWLGAIVDHEKSARSIAALQSPDDNTLLEWATRPGKAKRISERMTAIRDAWLKIEPYIELMKTETDKK